MVSLPRHDNEHFGPRQRATFLVLGVLALGWSLFCVVEYNTSRGVNQDWYPAVLFQKGMSFSTWHLYSYNGNRSREDLYKMRAAGVEWVAVNYQSYQSNLSSTDIHLSPASDSMANLTDAFNYARFLGLHIFYKPMLEFESGGWRSNVVYTPAWMTAYSAWIISQAAIAGQIGAEIFSIGCETRPMEGHSTEVRAMIAGVRSVYHGLITYAANYDSFWNIDWYDAIDIIGIDMYAPMLFTYTPSLTDMIQFWNGFYTRLEALSARWNRPIAFTEIGAQAKVGANLSPNIDRISDQQDVGWLVDMYKSIFQSKLWAAPWFKGAYWWIWDNNEPDPAHPELDTGFMPEIPAVLAAITAEYTTPHQLVPSDFLARCFVPYTTGIIILVVLAWKLDRKTPKQHATQKNEESRFGLAMLQGSLFGTLIYLGYANLLFPLYFTGYYNPPAFPLYFCISCVAMLVAGACMHLAARRAPRIILFISFLYAIGYGGTVSGLSLDGSLLKVYLDALMTGLVLASLVMVTSTSHVPGNAFLKGKIAIALVTLGAFLACTAIFDSLAASLTVVPVGLGLLAFRVPSRRKNNTPASNADNEVIESSSTSTSNSIGNAPCQPPSVVGTLFVALVAGLLLLLGSSDYNLLYMNLLPLTLSLLPPVFAGIAVVLLVLGLRAQLVKRHDASNRLLRWSENHARGIMSSRGILIYALVFEGIGIVLLASGAPHVIWAILAGILFILLASAVLLQIAGQEWTRNTGRLFLYLLLIVAITMAGTILDAIKGSTVYAFTSPVSYNVAIAINMLYTIPSFLVTAAGLAIELVMQKKIARKHHTT